VALGLILLHWVFVGQSDGYEAMLVASGNRLDLWNWLRVKKRS